ncbi:hypothetical protein TNCV_1134721 [Trichonephila clavipes]|nr:hypothetical protein TNCV_1134721 [Trichonephila clavipes]
MGYVVLFLQVKSLRNFFFLTQKTRVIAENARPLPRVVVPADTRFYEGHSDWIEMVKLIHRSSLSIKGVLHKLKSGDSHFYHRFSAYAGHL